jgi:Cu(I)/Ag(I) efflux system membrane fusion protein
MKNKTKIFVSVSALVFVAIAIAVHAYSSSDATSVPPVELNALFKLADKNKDGSISKEEFGEYLLHMKTKPAKKTFTAVSETADNGNAGGSCCGGKDNALSETVTETKKEGGCCGSGKSEFADDNVAKTEKTEKFDSPSNTPDGSEISASDHATLKVGGSCGMCKKRIETVAKSLEGVVAATWDIKTQILKVAFNSPPVSLDEVSKAIAQVGHDTEKDKADEETYNALHECCKYR